MVKAGYLNRYDKPDAIRLARELGTDRGLVYKWLNGTIKRVTHPPHLVRLPELLKTPKDYFRVADAQTPPRLEELEATVEALRPLLRVGDLQGQLDDLTRRVGLLERRGRDGRKRGANGG